MGLTKIGPFHVSTLYGLDQNSHFTGDKINWKCWGSSSRTSGSLWQTQDFGFPSCAPITCKIKVKNYEAHERTRRGLTPVTGAWLKRLLPGRLPNLSESNYLTPQHEILGIHTQNTHKHHSAQTTLKLHFQQDSTDALCYSQHATDAVTHSISFHVQSMCCMSDPVN